MSAAKPATAAIMQPYLLPYIGYFQLIASSDIFVVYDNIQYTKKGWINRNRILDSQDSIRPFVLPLEAASDYLDIYQRKISSSYDPYKILRQFTAAYKNAPNYSQFFPVLETIFLYERTNLFDFVFNSIKEMVLFLGIQTTIIKSSTLEVDPELRGTERVKSTCFQIGCNRYLNSIGGLHLYSFQDFENSKIELNFLKSFLSPYEQNGASFAPGLSIVDLVMRLPKKEVQRLIASDFKIITAKDI